jgi:hypothetical protein
MFNATNTPRHRYKPPIATTMPFFTNVNAMEI